MSDPKEALERLKIDEIANEAVHQWNAAGNPHLSTGAIGVARIAAEIARAGSIAEREGLEREVARQRDEIEQTRFLITGGEDAPGYAMSLPFSEIERVAHENLATWNYDVERAEAAESKLSALEGVVRSVVADLKGWDEAEAKAGAKAYKTPRHAYREAADILRGALLHPTVPVERKTVKRTMTINLTDEEMAALEKLAAEKDLKPPTIFRQALRVYQLYCLPEDHPERIGRSPTYGADRLSVAPPSQGMETADLSRAYTPTLIAFDDPPRIEYVNADVPHISRRIDERFALLLDMVTREPIGFTLYGKWTSALAALQSHKGGEAPLAEPSDPR